MPSSCRPPAAGIPSPMCGDIGGGAIGASGGGAIGALAGGARGELGSAGGGGDGEGGAYGPPAQIGLSEPMHAGSAGPVGMGLGGGGGGAYGPPAHTGLSGWLTHLGSAGPVGPVGSSRRAGVPCPLDNSGAACATTVAPVAAIPISITATVVFVIAARTAQAIPDSSIAPYVRPPSRITGYGDMPA